MSEQSPLRAGDLAWSEKAAQLAVDALLRAKAVDPQHANRAAEIIAKEVYDLLAVGDRPAP